MGAERSFASKGNGLMDCRLDYNKTSRGVPADKIIEAVFNEI